MKRLNDANHPALKYYDRTSSSDVERFVKDVLKAINLGIDKLFTYSEEVFHVNLIVEAKPAMQSVSSTMGQINAYNGLLNDEGIKIMVVLTLDATEKFDSMLKKQDINVFHIDITKAEKAEEVCYIHT